MQMEAKEAGFDNGVFIDANGNVGESSNMNVAFVTSDGVLVHPKFDHILSGCTSLRLLELATRHQESRRRQGRRGPRHSRRRGARRREMLLLGSSIKVAPIVQWDDQIDRRRQARPGQSRRSCSCSKKTCGAAIG